LDGGRTQESAQPGEHSTSLQQLAAALGLAFGLPAGLRARPRRSTAKDRAFVRARCCYLAAPCHPLRHCFCAG
jgi:hypothetical protein